MIYDFSVTSIEGDTIPLEEFQGQVLLIVNTASKCGFSSQMGELEVLYDKYRDRGFAVLAFPCNQFLQKEPFDDEVIRTYNILNYSVSFPMFRKIDVKGENAHPLFTYLKNEMPGMFGREIRWNFTKFLVSRSGKVVSRYAPFVSPEKIEEDILEQLRREA